MSSTAQELETVWRELEAQVRGMNRTGLLGMLKTLNSQPIAKGSSTERLRAAVVRELSREAK